MMEHRPKIPVAILGATGAVGQRFVQLLDGHPWFEIAILTGSERSIGRPYGEVVRWILDTPPPAQIAAMIVQPTTNAGGVPLAFSALPADQAHEAEPLWAAAGTVVCSNASAYRMDPLVPLLIPEVNPDHIGLIELQRNQRGWAGAIVTNPNCASITLVMALRPLHDRFRLKQVHATTMQSVSGAGYPGVASLDILDNVIPYIGGEEEKIESEPLKLLGTFKDGVVENAPIKISASVNRVPVLDGHLVSTSVSFQRPASIEEAVSAMREFVPPPQVSGLPSAPAHAIIVRDEPDRPQPRRDRNLYNGMGTTVGRVRPCALLDLKFSVLSHNTIRGAAGGALLNGELLVAEGLIG
jgi:aspartate-semialdehyde dehydrogenase